MYIYSFFAHCLYTRKCTVDLPNEEAILLYKGSIIPVGEEKIMLT